MKLLIPTKVQERVRFTIDKEIDFIDLTEKQKLNLQKKLISLWFFIYERQRNDIGLINLKGYTNINRSFLQKFQIRINKLYNYIFLIKLLKDVNLISVNGNKYSPGKYSKGYRVESSFINTDYTEVEIDFEKIFHNIKNKKQWLRKNPNYKKHINDLYDVKVDLGDYISWLRNNEGIKLKPVITNGILVNRFLTQERIYNYINDALKINFDNIWVKISNEGRFYNSSTNLSYTALPFIKLKRRKVIEIDITNNQPLLLNKFINNEQYKKDTEEGIFYEKMAEYMGLSRNAFKVLSYKYIFFSNRMLRGGKFYEAMEFNYPGFIEDINKLRGEMEISKELQKLESDIFVDKIGRLDFKMMLRHDAVFVYEEDYELVKNYVIKEYNKIGLNPTIKK